MASRKTTRPDPEDVLRTLELEGSFVPGHARGRVGRASGRSGKVVVTVYDAGGEEIERRSFASRAEAERVALAFSEDHAGEGLFALVSPHQVGR